MYSARRMSSSTGTPPERVLALEGNGAHLVGLPHVSVELREGRRAQVRRASGRWCARAAPRPRAGRRRSSPSCSVASMPGPGAHGARARANDRLGEQRRRDERRRRPRSRRCPERVAGTPAVRWPRAPSGSSRERVSVRIRNRIAAARSTNAMTSTSPGTAIEGMSDTAMSPIAARSGIRAVSTTWSTMIASSPVRADDQQRQGDGSRRAEPRRWRSPHRPVDEHPGSARHGLGRRDDPQQRGVAEEHQRHEHDPDGCLDEAHRDGGEAVAAGDEAGGEHGDASSTIAPSSQPPGGRRA